MPPSRVAPGRARGQHERGIRGPVLQIDAPAAGQTRGDGGGDGRAVAGRVDHELRGDGIAGRELGRAVRLGAQAVDQRARALRRAIRDDDALRAHLHERDDG